MCFVDKESLKRSCKWPVQGLHRRDGMDLSPLSAQRCLSLAVIAEQQTLCGDCLSKRAISHKHCLIFSSPTFHNQRLVTD